MQCNSFVVSALYLYANDHTIEIVFNPIRLKGSCHFPWLGSIPSTKISPSVDGHLVCRKCAAVTGTHCTWNASRADWVRDGHNDTTQQKVEYHHCTEERKLGVHSECATCEFLGEVCEMLVTQLNSVVVFSV